MLALTIVVQWLHVFLGIFWFGGTLTWTLSSYHQ